MQKDEVRNKAASSTTSNAKHNVKPSGLKLIRMNEVQAVTIN